MAPARPARDGRAGLRRPALRGGAARRGRSGLRLRHAVARRRATFPPQLRPGARYLSDAAGRPFFLHGDTAWSLIARSHPRGRRALPARPAGARLQHHPRQPDRAPLRDATRRPTPTATSPSGGPGTSPRRTTRYFDHADWVLRRACELGFLVLLTPSYAGYGGGPKAGTARWPTSGADKLERLRAVPRHPARRPRQHRLGAGRRLRLPDKDAGPGAGRRHRRDRPGRAAHRPRLARKRPARLLGRRAVARRQQRLHLRARLRRGAARSTAATTPCRSS